MPSLRFGAFIRGKNLAILLHTLLYFLPHCLMPSGCNPLQHRSFVSIQSKVPELRDETPLVKVPLTTKSVSHVQVLKENAAMN